MTSRRRFLTAGAAGALAVPVAQAAPRSSSRRAREIIRTLGLRPLEGESGLFCELRVSDAVVRHAGRELRAQSAIYYFLDRAHPQNHLHWLEPDDTQVLCEGGPLDYFVFHPDGRAERTTVGSDLAKGQRPVISVPAGCWKALRLHPRAEFALLVNVLTPQWTLDRVRVGAGREFVERYAGRASWATPAFLRELIGPNWRG